MKIYKIAALFLSFVMVSGTACACGKSQSPLSSAKETTETMSTAETALPSETTAVPTETAAVSSIPSDIITPAAGVTDTDTTPIVIYSYNDDFKVLLDTYFVPAHPGFTYDYRVIDPDQYQPALNNALSSGTDAPDIFLADADYAKKYVNTSYTLNINELGISNSELSDQFAFTYKYTMSEKGAVKGVCWQVNPCGVIYNRTLAKTYLGSDDPAVVSGYFSTWSDFKATAELVSTASGGAVKAVSGMDDIRRTYLNSRTRPWSENGVISLDSVMFAYFDYGKQLFDESLTFGTRFGSAEWTANTSNSSVLSFWGPLPLLFEKMNFGYDADGVTVSKDANPTTGGWGLCAAPSGCDWGDVYIFASKYDDNKAATAEIMAVYSHYGYFCDNTGNLICMDLNTMQMIWAVQLGDNSDVTPVIEEEDGRVYLYTGTQVNWQRTDEPEYTGAAYTYKFDAMTGEEVWQTSQPCHTRNGESADDSVNGGMYGTPVCGRKSISDLVIYSYCMTTGINSGNMLVAYDKTTGEEVWRYAMNMYSWSSPVDCYDADGNAYIIICDSIGQIHLVNGLTGTRINFLQTIRGKGTADETKTGLNMESSPIVYNGMIVIGTRAGSVFGVKIK